MTLQNLDLTEKECQLAVANKTVSWVQANPNDMSIIFLTSKGDKGYIVTTKGGPVKRYKNNFDRELVIAKIKGC
jgi:hypothetical protein